MANSVYSDYAMNVRLSNYQIINAVQGEVNTRWITVNFMNDNIPYDLTGLFLTINMIKKDSTVIFNDGTIIDNVNGQAKFLITSQMVVEAGTFDIFFKIYGDSPPSELKITGFQLIVEPANNDAGIISSNEFNALQSLIGQVQPAITDINAAITNVNTAITNVNVAITNANTATSQANLARDQANLATNSANQAATEVKNYYQMIDPFNGQTNYVSNVVLELYTYLFANSIKAGEFDALNMTAGVFDSKNMTAMDFDMKAKQLLA